MRLTVIKNEIKHTAKLDELGQDIVDIVDNCKDQLLEIGRYLVGLCINLFAIVVIPIARVIAPLWIPFRLAYRIYQQHRDYDDMVEKIQTSNQAQRIWYLIRSRYEVFPSSTYRKLLNHCTDLIANQQQTDFVATYDKINQKWIDRHTKGESD